MGYAGKFAAVSKAVPLGKVSSPQAMTEGVAPSRLPPQVKIASYGKKVYTIKKPAVHRPQERMRGMKP